MTRARSKKTVHPFPFVGAGDAAYFETVEVFVRFVRAPDPKARRALRKSMPPVFYAFRLNGADLVASGEAPRNAARANASIEKWLLAMHAIAPIRIAIRPEDPEAGGTRFSAWHRWSVDHARSLLSTLPMRWGLGDPVRAVRSAGDQELVRLRALAKRDRTFADACVRAAEMKMHSVVLEARKLFDVAIENPELDPRAYCNALYTLRRVGREKPRRALHERFVERALPHARINPTIHVNAAGVWMALGDPDAAIASLERAKKLRAPGLAGLRTAFAALSDHPHFARIFGRGPH